MRAIAANGVLSAGTALLTAAYPFAVYFLMDHGSLRLAGLALLAAMFIRFLLPGTIQLQVLTSLAVGAIFAAAIVLTNSETLARLYPVGVNAALVAAFGVTLIHPPSMIERIARATGVALDGAGVSYTRAVTVIWSASFW